MANYIKYITLFSKEKSNDIAFNLDNGDELKGTIIDSCGWMFITAWNLFDRIGLKDPMEFFSSIVGKENVKSGSWPYVKGKDNLRKVLKALSDYRADRIPESKKVIISDDDEKKPFTLSVKKHKPTKLNFQL